MGTVKLVKLTGEYYEDENFNRWSVDKYTEKQAIAASESLKRCKLCTNCENCEDCKICIDCEYCIDCRGCVDCVRCESCDECWYCVECEYCEKCNDCVYCMDCEHCDTCESCEECTYLLNSDYETKIISNAEEKIKGVQEISHCLECGEVMYAEVAKKNIKKYGVLCCCKACAEKFLRT